MALNLEVFNFDTYKKMDLGGKLYIIPSYSTDEHLCFKTHSAPPLHQNDSANCDD